MNTIKKIALLFLSIIAFHANAQTDAATTARIIEEKRYIFTATAAIPLNSNDINNVLNRMPGNVNGGGVINLVGNSYDLKVTPDSVVSFLPFYGRAFRAGYNNDENGYKFTSKDFTYSSQKRKRGGWDITIKTNDAKDNVRMSLSITTSGYATLAVTSNNKQTITYNGYLSEIKKPA